MEEDIVENKTTNPLGGGQQQSAILLNQPRKSPVVTGNNNESRLEILARFANADEIIPGLYLGSMFPSRSLATLQGMKVKRILSVCKGIAPKFKEFEYMVVPVDDAVGEDLLSYFPFTNYFIEHTRKIGNIYVHCLAGVSRSSTIVIAYLMWSMRIPLDMAFSIVKRARSHIQPNIGFMRQLAIYERILLKQQFAPTLNLNSKTLDEVWLQYYPLYRLEFVAKTTSDMTFMKAICGQDPEDYILEANIRQTLLRQISITEFSFSSPLPSTSTTTTPTTVVTSSATPATTDNIQQHIEDVTSSPSSSSSSSPSSPSSSSSSSSAANSGSSSRLHSPTSLIVNSSDLFAVLSRLWKKQQQAILEPCVPFLEASSTTRTFADLLNGVFDIDIDIISTANDYKIAPDEELYDISVWKCKNCAKILFTPLNVIPSEEDSEEHLIVEMMTWMIGKDYDSEDPRCPRCGLYLGTTIWKTSEEKNEFTLQGQGCLVRVNLSEVNCTKVHYRVHVLSNEVEESSTSDERETDHDTDSDDEDRL
eukprot:TRINITY_DN1406_c0_g1_i1.p1 TRINITY_DN1406_c0_g1~~TRINITY_DN1406_c0_g1_i1.p1  ORF type:complete len:534 (+),score=125.20 TRINITY_DN1406_c0_g1_i1:135-1736(+)